MRPLDSHPLLYRLLLAVDIQAYSARSTREQLRAQRELNTALDTAAVRVGLDRARWDEQPAGDGGLATLPEGTDPAPVAGDFVLAFARALAELNQGGQPGRGDRPALRVRLALHHGTLTAGPFGPAGDAPIVVQRLLDCEPLRRVLREDSSRDLAYVVSDSLFDDVVRTGFCAFAPTEFAAVKVRAKGAVFHGHIFTGRTRGRGAADAPPGPLVPSMRVPDFPALAARRG